MKTDNGLSGSRHAVRCGVDSLADSARMPSTPRAVDEFRRARGIRQPLLRVDYSCRQMINP